MMPHLAFTLLAALLVAAAMAAMESRTPRQRLYAAARVFVSCTVATVGGSWLMRLIHG